jgi:hypothetical protein
MSSLSYTDHTVTDILQCRSLQREEYDVLEVGHLVRLVLSIFTRPLVLVYLSRVFFEPSSGQYVNIGDTSRIY